MEGLKKFKVNVRSFGFKYGVDEAAQLSFDVRGLPNPFYLEELKHKTGLEKEVRDYVLSTNEAKEFLNKLISFLDCALSVYESAGREEVTISFGCTGGHHRSVTFATVIYEYLSDRYPCTILHRDISKEN